MAQACSVCRVAHSPQPAVKLIAPGRLLKYGYRVGEVKLSKKHGEGQLTLVRWREKRHHAMRFADGYAFSRSYMIPDLNDIPTVADGVCSRIFGDVLECDALHPLMERFMDDFVKTLPVIPGDAFMDTEEWLDTCNLPGWRKDLIRKALTEFGDDVDALPEDFVYACFGKDEEYDDYKPVRGIFGQSDRLKGLFGPLFTTIENWLFEVLPSIKHVDLLEWPQEIIDVVFMLGALYRATDYSSMEKSHREWVTRRLVFRCYRHMCQLNARAMLLLALAYATRQDMSFVFRGFVTRTSFRLPTGSRDTAVSNYLLNHIITSFVAWWRDIKEKHMCEGDDALQALMARYISARLDRAMANLLGLNLTFEVAESLFGLSFCGQIMDEDARQLIVDPCRALLRFGWIPYKHQMCRRSKILALYRMKALSLLLLYGSCPVVGSFCKMVLRQTRRVDHRVAIKMERNSYVKEFYEKVDSQWQYLLREGLATGGSIQMPEPARATRELFDQHFNMGVDMQRRIEAEFDNASDVSEGIGNFDNSWFTLYCDTRNVKWRYNSDNYVTSAESGFNRPAVKDPQRLKSLAAKIKNPALLSELALQGHTDLRNH